MASFSAFTNGYEIKLENGTSKASLLGQSVKAENNKAVSESPKGTGDNWGDL